MAQGMSENIRPRKKEKERERKKRMVWEEEKISHLFRSDLQGSSSHDLRAQLNTHLFGALTPTRIIC